MSFLVAFFYDRFMARAEQACLQEWRRELLGNVHGAVLEIGAGTGASVEHYPDRVTRLVLSEPDRHMRRVLESKIGDLNDDRIRVVEGSAEHTGCDDAAFDFVVTSLVCCSVASLEDSLREIRRVLKPGGCLVFLEHVAAVQGSSRRKWQDRITPFWRRFAGNCHLNRETERAIVAAGFAIRDITRESMRKAIPLVRPTIRGLAEKV